MFILGIAVPPPDIVYTVLGTLIKERKIYHTGEGYFIVTPQTYFITNAATLEHRRGLLAEGPPRPTSVTYLVSMESCAESAKENTSPLAHCQSCLHFPDVCARKVQESPTTAEVTGKGPKCLGEPKPLVRNQAVLASEENHLLEDPNSPSCAKDRERGKKFGFSLFWRNISRREKSRTKLTNFSAQFPPEEWPVRDEDDLDNIPRDIEHEIIKRINPVLTVDNLIKHTALMQKHELKKYTSQGTSTDVLIVRQKQPTKEVSRKRQGWSAKPRKRGHLFRDRHKSGDQGSTKHPESIRRDKHPKLPASHVHLQVKSASKAVEKSAGENMLVLDSHLVYKRQISNPFQGLSPRGGPVTKGPKGAQKTNDLKPSQLGTKGKPGRRARSLGSSKVLENVTKQQHNEKTDTGACSVSDLSVLPATDDLKGHLASYPQCGTLQNESKCCSFRGGMLRHAVYSEEPEALPDMLGKCSSHFDLIGEMKERQPSLPPLGAASLDRKSSICLFVDKTIDQFQNLGLLDYPVGTNHMKSENQDRDSGELQDTEAASVGDERLSDDAQTLFPNEEEEDGACSSLYLEEDDFSEDDNFCEMVSGPLQYSFTCDSKGSHLGKLKVAGRSFADSLTEYDSNIYSSELPVFQGTECYKTPQALPNPVEALKAPHSAESRSLALGTLSSYHREEPSVVTSVSVPVDGNTFHYYSQRKAGSEDEALQGTVGVMASWSPSPQNQDLKKRSTPKAELFGTSRVPVLVRDMQHERSHLEGTESHSMAGDSGIDSPQ